MYRLPLYMENIIIIVADKDIYLYYIKLSMRRFRKVLSMLSIEEETLSIHTQYGIACNNNINYPSFRLRIVMRQTDRRSEYGVKCSICLPSSRSNCELGWKATCLD